MSDDWNDLFPKQPGKPDREHEPPEFTQEDEDELEAILADEMVEDMASDFECMIRDIASKWAFEVLMTLINPDPESKQKIIDGCVEIAAARVKGEMERRGQEMSEPEVKQMLEDVNKSFRKAQERFRADYDDDLMDGEFLERCRKAVRRNLSR